MDDGDPVIESTGSGAYKWEAEYERSWEALREDDEGRLSTAISGIERQDKRKQRTKARIPRTALGMMRHLVVMLDCSSSMLMPDYRPSRLAACQQALRRFAVNFFDQNPISQLGIIRTQRKRAERIVELTGNSRKILSALNDTITADGQPSLQNALDLAYSMLSLMPAHSSKELLILMSSLSTVDPGDINVTIEKLRTFPVRCSAICLSAETRVLKHLCEQTCGSMSVPLDSQHLEEILSSHLNPPAVSPEPALIRMGFPYVSKDTPIFQTVFCACHSEPVKSDAVSYSCPQCSLVYCELPVDCKACGLTLASAAHLARSYQHLFPLNPFVEGVLAAGTNCNGCNCSLNSGSEAFQCTDCLSYFCLDCDLFLHESLHSCPICVHQTDSSKLQ